MKLLEIFAAFELPEFCTASMPLFQLVVLENVFRARQEFEATWSIPASFETLQYLGTCRCVFFKNHLILLIAHRTLSISEFAYDV